MSDKDAGVEQKTERPGPKPGIASWPLWKVMGLGVGVYGALAIALVLTSTLRSRIPSSLMTILAGMTVVLGPVFLLWAWKDYRLVPRLGGVAVVATVFLAIGIWFWGIVLTGWWLLVVVAGMLSLYALAWALPGVSRGTAAFLWREQTTPQTRVGRKIFTWVLGLGLGGAGIVGASFGTSLSRTGDVALASLIVAVGMSAVAIFMAQGFSYQLWPRMDPDESVHAGLNPSSGPTP